MLSEKSLNEIKKVRVGAYDMNYGETLSFLQMSKESDITAIYSAFKYGFLKGQRAAKAAAKKKAVQA